MGDAWDAVVPFAGSAPLLAEHRRALPQVDQLCGPFWVRLALLADAAHAAGLPSVADVARAAGTLVCPALDTEVRPPREPAHRAGWESLPHTVNRERAGTTAVGVAAAIDSLTQGRLTAVPISGTWHPTDLGHLLDRLSRFPATIIANVDTSALWGSHTSHTAVAAYLADGDDRHGLSADWSVGHFVVVWGRLHGERDDACASMVAVADTYLGLGRDGLHLQPVSRLAAALTREHSTSDGGLLAVVRATDRTHVEAAAVDAGFVADFWRT